MSYFAFQRDEDGNVLINEDDIANYLEELLNEIKLLNMRFEEAFDTKINLEDIE